MKRRLFSVILALVFLVSCFIPAVLADTDQGSISDAEAAQRYLEKKSALEQKYGLVINDSQIESLGALGKTSVLTDIELGFSFLPEHLTEAVRSMLTARRRTLQLVLAFPYSGDGWGGTFNEKGDVLTMYDYDDPRYLVHEYGHLVYTLVGEKVGRGAIAQRMSELSNGAPYRNQAGFREEDEFWDYFVTPYARNSVYEDFPETFSFLLSNPRFLWSIWEELGPDACPNRKADYVRSLVLQTFGLAEEDLPQAVPPQPSPWAKDAVDRYLELFSGGLRSYKYDEHGGYINYRVGAPRGAFAYGAYYLADKLLWESEGKSLWIKVFTEHDPEFSLAAGSEQERKTMDKLNPFTDARFQREILVLYLMGVINGKSEHVFDPDGTITREQAAAMLYRLCVALGYDFSAVTPVEPADAAACSDWAMESIRMICGAGIMNGVGGGVFDPKGTYTYEQSAITLNRVYDLLTR